MVGERLDAPQEDEEEAEEEQLLEARPTKEGNGGNLDSLYAAGARGTRRVPEVPPVFVLFAAEKSSAAASAFPRDAGVDTASIDTRCVCFVLFPNRRIVLYSISSLAYDSDHSRGVFGSEKMTELD